MHGLFIGVSNMIKQLGSFLLTVRTVAAQGEGRVHLRWVTSPSEAYT